MNNTGDDSKSMSVSVVTNPESRQEVVEDD